MVGSRFPRPRSPAAFASGSTTTAPASRRPSASASSIASTAPRPGAAAPPGAAAWDSASPARSSPPTAAGSGSRTRPWAAPGSASSCPPSSQDKRLLSQRLGAGKPPGRGFPHGPIRKASAEAGGASPPAGSAPTNGAAAGARGDDRADQLRAPLGSDLRADGDGPRSRPRRQVLYRGGLSDRPQTPRRGERTSGRSGRTGRGRGRGTGSGGSRSNRSRTRPGDDEPVVSPEAQLEFACFGGIASVHVRGSGEEQGRRLAERGRELLLDAHQRLSRFDPDSELSRLNRDPRTEVPASPLLRRLVAAVLTAGSRSGGLVDATLLDAIERAGYRSSLEGAEAPPPTRTELAAQDQAPARASP